MTIARYIAGALAAVDPSAAANPPTRTRLTWYAAFLSVWIAAGVYAYLGMDRGWVPHDEGQFFQAAARTKAGEMPHRDFDEPYTGGLTYLHAAALYALDDALISLRVPLLVFFMLWIPAVFYLASRFGPPLMAAAISGLAAVWSVPNYFAPVPSWYNLFFAVFGVAAVTRYLETDRARWLFVAGLCGGLSFIVKIPGLYYVAGVLVFLLLREQSIAWERGGEDAVRSRRYSALISCILLVFIGLVASTVTSVRTASAVLVFFAPSATIALAVLLRELRYPPGAARTRAASLARMAVPFLAGVGLPVALYCLFFVFAGGWPGLFHDLFIAPRRRLQFASFATPLFSVWLCTPILVLVALSLWHIPRVSRIVVVIVGGLLSVLLVSSASSRFLYLVGWRPLVFILAVVVVAAVSSLLRARSLTIAQQSAALVVFVTATCSLVQFPFPAPIYFCYIAPLVGLSLAATSSVRHHKPHPFAALLLVFYLLFGVFRVTPGFIYVMGRHYEQDRLTAKMHARRAKGLRVFPEEARRYDRVVALLLAHARGGPIYAFPDAPEVYVLAEMPNPTPTLYEFLTDPPVSDATVLDRLAWQDIRAVVINTARRFSSPPSEYLLRHIRDRFPHGASVDEFEVRWRE